MDNRNVRRIFRPEFLVLGVLLTGCSFPGDTSAPNPQHQYSSQEVDAMIAKIQNDPHIPDGVKATQIAHLQDLKKRPKSQ